jgi:outer membrane biosynthesis protein TonB
MRKFESLALVAAACIGMAACSSKHIVRAAPPSVSAPPQEEPVLQPAPQVPPAVEPAPEPAPEVPSPEPPPAPTKRPVPPRPRPAPAETAEPAPPKPAPPQISPQLSAQDLDKATKNTRDNITAAEQNLQQANGKRLGAAQKDLVEKITGFLSQAHEAIVANDWVRAQNLAEKARVLSAELVKSL